MDGFWADGRARHHLVARRPLVIGLIAAGGAGLYYAAQPGDEPGKPGVEPSKPGVEQAPLAPRAAKPANVAPVPQFGQVVLREESPVAAVTPADPIKARVSENFASSLQATTGRGDRPATVRVQIAATRISRHGRRYHGSFAVPPREIAAPSFTPTQAAPVPEVAGVQEALAMRSAGVSAPGQSALGVSELAAPAAAVPATAVSLSPPTAPDVVGLVQPIPDAAAAPPAGEMPAGNGAIALPKDPAPDLIPSPQASNLQLPTRPGAVARVPIAPAPAPLAIAPAPAAAVGKTGIEGLAGLDDANLAAVRPVGAVSGRQHATSVKPRGGEAASRPDGRASTAEEAPSTPDEISAAGTGTDLHIPATIYDSASGTLPLRVGADGSVTVRLGDLLALVGKGMGKTSYNALANSSANDTQISLSQLRAAGIELRYERASNRVRLSAKAA